MRKLVNVVMHSGTEGWMPYELEWEPSGLIARFSGVVSGEDLEGVNSTIYASEAFPEIRYQIIDFSNIDDFAASPDAVRDAARSDEIAGRLNPDVKVAIISSEAFIRGMSNMYALTHEGSGGSWETQVFDVEAEARAWVEDP